MMMAVNVIAQYCAIPTALPGSSKKDTCLVVYIRHAGNKQTQGSYCLTMRLLARIVVKKTVMPALMLLRFKSTASEGPVTKQDERFHAMCMQ
jgi:hypothetical protein